MAEKDNSEDIVKSPIIMKVDAPTDDNNSNNSSADEKSSIFEKKHLNEHTPFQNNSNLKSSPSRIPVLAKPKFSGGNPFAMKPNVLSSPKFTFGNGLFSDSSSKTLLRPSKLSQQIGSTSSSENNTTSKSFAFNTTHSNPFSKTDKLNENEIELKTEEKVTNQSEPIATNSNNTNTTVSNDPPKFVPLSGGGNSNPSSSNINSISSTNLSSSSSASFIFGQNLRDRVVSDKAEGNGIDTSPAVPSSSSNGTSDTLFSSAVNDTSELQSTSSEIKSLSEAAREYEESRAQKRKYEEVTVITGEENEENIMQIGCKLFAFDQTTRNWQERGRGNLRLNDIMVNNNDSTKTDNSDDETDTRNNCHKQSRLVVRSAGSLRVVLNTKIWAGMSVEMPSSKSIRLTAMDSNGVVKVFLVMANVKEIEKLFVLLKNRVETEIKRQNETSCKRKNTNESKETV